MKLLLKKAKIISILILAISILGCDADDSNLPEVVANFTFSLNENTGTVVFNNTSEDAQIFLWDFGNGVTSTEVNPIITFENGTFTVTLNASNIAGASNTFEEELTVEIIIPAFDSGLLTNGDFESGSDPWFGSGLNVVTEGDNSFNLVDVQVAGNTFDVNISQVVEIIQGTNYILTFDASASVDRTIVAGIGLNVDPFTSAAPLVNLTTETQTFTLQLTASDFGGVDSRVLFDMGGEVGVVVIDNVSLVEGGDGSDSASGFDSGLLTNGDFESGSDPWFGNGLNIVTEGGNSFNLVDVQVAGNPFDVNISQVVEIIQGTNYILTFDASASVDRTIVAGIGLNVDPFTSAAPLVDLTTEIQTFTLQLTASDFGGADSRVLFDMGGEVGVVVIDNVSLVEGGDGSDSTDGFDAGLLINGDFENGADPWIQGVDENNPAPVVTENDNSFYSINITDPDPDAPFLVNLTQKLPIIPEATYTLTFDAWSDTDRSIIAGIGLSDGDFSSTTVPVNITTSIQTFTLTLTASGFGDANSRVLFDLNAEAGLVNIDNVSLVLN